MRRFWIILAAVILAGQAQAKAADATADLQPSVMASRLDDLGFQITRCDDGEAFYCKLAAQALATSGSDLAQTLESAAEPPCLKGDATACWQLGVSLTGRLVTDRSAAAQTVRQQALVRATTLFSKACESGSMSGCRDLARSYWWHRGVAEDKLRVVTLMQRACNGDLASACLDLSDMMRQGYMGFDRDPLRGARALMRACELRDPKACLILANEIDNHSEMMADWHGAPAVPDLYLMACSAHLSSACNRLGEHYEQGVGVPVDDVQSATFYRRSCNLDDAYGCSNLAGKLRDGEGVSADRPAAMTLFARACQRYVPACSAEADLLSEGQPSIQSQITALKLYSDVCAKMRSTEDCRKMADLRGRIIAQHQLPGASKPILIPGRNDSYYPAEASRRHEEGRSVAHFTVLPDGTTTNCTASGATPTLDAATCDHVVPNLHYLPGTDNAGNPVAMDMTSNVNWRFTRD